MQASVLFLHFSIDRCYRLLHTKDAPYEGPQKEAAINDDSRCKGSRGAGEDRKSIGTNDDLLPALGRGHVGYSLSREESRAALVIGMGNVSRSVWTMLRAVRASSRQMPDSSITARILAASTTLMLPIILSITGSAIVLAYLNNPARERSTIETFRRRREERQQKSNLKKGQLTSHV